MRRRDIENILWKKKRKKNKMGWVTWFTDFDKKQHQKVLETMNLANGVYFAG